MAEVRLDSWSVSCGGDPFMAPEARGVVLVGIVTGHPIKPDGSRVRTSVVVRAVGRLAYTRSGTAYRLGAPSIEYRAWLWENRPDWDPENPIKMIGVNGRPA